MDVDAQHGPLVRHFVPHEMKRSANSVAEPDLAIRVFLPEEILEAKMGRGILLWLLGVPIPVIILLWLFFGH